MPGYDEEERGRLTEETEVPVLPVQPFSRPHVLRLIRGPMAPDIIELRGDTLIIGRSPEADIRIDSSALSRQHVRLEKYQGGYRVVDLDSSNGVYLNEIRIHSAALRDGDMLQLGNAVFVYHEGN